MREKINEILGNKYINIAICGFALRLIYILYTPYYMGQNDASTLGSGNGHFGYIEYFVNGGSILPSENPMGIYQFYHPPLHHIIASIFVRINLLFGASMEHAFENLQFLTLFYSCLVMYLSYKIISEFELKEKAKVLAYLIVVFQPTFIIFSGSMNNDQLCYVFMLATIYAALRWKKKPDVKNIIIIAVCLAASVLSKASGILIAPSLAIIFISELIERIKNKKGKKTGKEIEKLIGQFTIFGVIAIPISLSWCVYNYVKFGMPLNYVPGVKVSFSLFNGGIKEVIHRFFHFENGPFKSISITFKGNDYNILVSMLKSSVLGEYTLTGHNIEWYLFIILFIVNVILALVAFVAIIRYVIKKNKPLLYRLFVGVTYIFIMFMYLRFCFLYPPAWTTNFRYIPITVLLGAIAVGQLYSEVEDKKNISKALMYLVYVWTGVAVITYVMLGYFSRGYGLAV